MVILTTEGWEDYELIDSGDGRKLERFGSFVLDRPDPQAIWQRNCDKARWEKANAFFKKVDNGSGLWVKKPNLPSRWEMKIDDISVWVEPTPFKHTGIFPEQSNHWSSFSQKIKLAGRPIKLLNLFAYTGIASLFAAKAGAEVTHVDSSRKSISWAKDNQSLSNLSQQKIRWILDDATSFVQRESRRNSKYDAIILDPPVYGHGPNSEIWNFDLDFPNLLKVCSSILSPKPLFILVSAYATTNSPISLGNVLSDTTSGLEGILEVGELTIKEKNSPRLLPAGIFASWSAKKS